MANRIFHRREREAERQARQVKTVAIALVLMLGLGVGAMLVVLLLSRSNHDLRAEIADSVEDTIHALEQEMADLRRRLEDRA